MEQKMGETLEIVLQHGLKTEKREGVKVMMKILQT